MKFGVSGCTRECAEAQGKDVGIIATDAGWNLYVGGNGGMKPRHADLLASDLDRETLIKLIDRFMMFYVTSADKLQRTSVWLGNLEGGVDYLREVIVDDKLGLAETLEARYPDPHRQLRVRMVAHPQRRGSAQAFQPLHQQRQARPGRSVRQRTRPARPALAERIPSTRSRWKPNDEIACQLNDILWAAWTFAPCSIASPSNSRWRLSDETCLPTQRHPAGHRRLRSDRRSPDRPVPPERGGRGVRHRQPDPFFAANVLSRGIVGEHDGELWVASPLKKQRFRLRDGHCLENPPCRCKLSR
jgi:hypothetical protein